jgi:hypothetical protein
MELQEMSLGNCLFRLPLIRGKDRKKVKGGLMKDEKEER